MCAHECVHTCIPTSTHVHTPSWVRNPSLWAEGEAARRVVCSGLSAAVGQRPVYAPLPQPPEPTLLPMEPSTVHTGALFVGQGLLGRGAGGAEGSAGGASPLRFQFAVSGMVLNMRIWGRCSRRAAVHRGGATCTGKAIFALASECQEEPCGLEASALRVLLSAS